MRLPRPTHPLPGFITGRFLTLTLTLALALPGPLHALTRLYTIGNSFTDHISGTPALSLALGEQIDFGRHTIPGAGLGFIWANPTGGFGTQGFYPQALPGKAWDYVTLQAWNEPLSAAGTHATNFAGLAFQGNQSARVLVLATSSFTKLPTTAPGTFHAAFLADGAANGGSRAFFHGMVDNLRAAHPGRTFGLVPIQHVMAEIDRRLAAGQTVPTLAVVRDLLTTDGHFNDRGRHLAALTTYYTTVRRYPTAAQKASFAASSAIDPAFIAYAWDLVWDLVQAEPYAQLVDDGGVPTAAFTPASPAALRGTAPFTVHFDASASRDSDGTLVSYAWTFGDGATGTGVNASRTYAAGVFPVVLTVTDDDGKAAAARAYVQVSSGSPDPVALEAEGAAVGENWIQVLDPNASLGVAVTPRPGFNLTGTTAPSAAADRVRFTFQTPVAGAYTIHARVNAPTTSADSFFVRVNGGAWFVWNNIGTGSAQFIWSRLPNTYALPLGEVTVDFAYRENGTVLDKLQLSLATTAPSGMGLPGVNIFYDEAPPSVPAGLAATAVRVNGADLAWSPSTDDVGVQTYEVYRGGVLVGLATQPSLTVDGLQPATNHVFTVRARDAAGNVSAASAPLPVATPANRPPTARIHASTTKGPAPLTVTLDGTGSTDPDAGDVVIGYDWVFGDGATEESVNVVTHTYTTPGLYTVRLEVIDLFGLAHTTTATIAVTGPQLLQAWREHHFGPGAAAGTGVAADDHDADRDGLGNLLEYALGGSPVDALDTPTPRPALIAETLAYTFRRARGDITYVVEASGNLRDWTPIAENPGQVGEEVTVTDTQAPAPGTPRFLRLRVRLTE